MPETDDALDEFTNMSLLLLSWILECQDSPTPEEREADAVEEKTFAVARTLSEHLLRRAEECGAQRPTAAAIRDKFASLIDVGCRTADGGSYSLHGTMKKNCIVGSMNQTPLHKCLISFKYWPSQDRYGVD